MTTLLQIITATSYSLMSVQKKKNKDEEFVFFLSSIEEFSSVERFFTNTQNIMLKSVKKNIQLSQSIKSILVYFSGIS